MTFCRTEVKQNLKAVRNLFAFKKREENEASRQVRKPHHSSVFLSLSNVSCHLSLLLFRPLRPTWKLINISWIPFTECFFGKPWEVTDWGITAVQKSNKLERCLDGLTVCCSLKCQGEHSFLLPKQDKEGTPENFWKHSCRNLINHADTSLTMTWNNST